MKESKLKKKDLVARVEKLLEQFSDLNNRLNRVSYEKVKQSIQLGQLNEDNASLQQRLVSIETQIDHLASKDSDLIEQCRALQEQISAPSVVSVPDQQQSLEEINQLALQLQRLQEQFQEIRQSLENDRQSVDHISNKSDDLRRDTDELLGHIRRLEESGSELLVSDSNHESQIHGLQSDIAELFRKLEQALNERKTQQSDPSPPLQETTDPLRNKLERLSHLISENSGKSKDVERRLSELANRIGETGARIDHLTQDRERFDESLEHRLSGLEAVVERFKSAIEVERDQPERLDERLKQVGLETDRVLQEVATLQENYHLLSDRDKAITARMDGADDAIKAQSELSQSTQDLVIRLADDLAGDRGSIDERLMALDRRISDYIEHDAEQPDPIAFISDEVAREKQQFSEEIDKLKVEIDAFQSKLQLLDTNEHEVSDRLNHLAGSVDQQASQRGELQQALISTREELSRSIQEIYDRLESAEGHLSQQSEAVQEQTAQLVKLIEAIAEQHKSTEAFKHLTTVIQADAGGLKESSSKLHQRLNEVEQGLKDEEQSKDQVFQRLVALEQGQTELSEQSDLGMDSLGDQLKAVSTQLVEQTVLSDGLSQRLDDLASSLEEQFHNLDLKHQQMVENQSDHQQRLSFQESNSHSITETLSELKTGYQKLLGKSEQQTTFLDAMTAEYGKRQQDSEKVTQQLGKMGDQLKSVQTTRSYHTKALAGLSVLFLLLGLVGYWFVTDEIDDVERGVSVELEQYSKNYVTRDEIEQLSMPRDVEASKSTDGFDAEAVTEIIKKQEDFEQQLAEIEEQLSTSFDNAGDRSIPVVPDQITLEQRQQQTSAVGSVVQGGTSNQLIEDQVEHKEEGTFDAANGELMQHVEKLEPKEDTTPDPNNEIPGSIDEAAASQASSEEPRQQLTTTSRPARDWQSMRGDGGYTIQLLGVSNIKSITTFSKQHNLASERAYIETTLNGKKWYILMYGIYDTYSEATKALKSLPDALKHAQPWIRSVPSEGVLTPF